MNARNKIETVSTHVRFPIPLREWFDQRAVEEGYATTQDLILEVCRDYKRLMEGAPSRYASAAKERKARGRNGHSPKASE